MLKTKKIAGMNTDKSHISIRKTQPLPVREMKPILE